MPRKRAIGARASDICGIKTVICGISIPGRPGRAQFLSVLPAKREAREPGPRATHTLLSSRPSVSEGRDPYAVPHREHTAYGSPTIALRAISGTTRKNIKTYPLLPNRNYILPVLLVRGASRGVLEVEQPFVSRSNPRAGGTGRRTGPFDAAPAAVVRTHGLGRPWAAVRPHYGGLPSMAGRWCG